MNHSLNSVIWRCTNADILGNVHLPVMFVISRSRSRILWICINAYTGESLHTSDVCSKSLRVLHHLETHQYIHSVVACIHEMFVTNHSWCGLFWRKHVHMCSMFVRICSLNRVIWCCTNACLENILIYMMFIINHSRWRMIWMYINAYILENIYIVWYCNKSLRVLHQLKGMKK